jgi:hypothetical protein
MTSNSPIGVRICAVTTGSSVRSSSRITSISVPVHTQPCYRLNCQIGGEFCRSVPSGQRRPYGIPDNPERTATTGNAKIIATAFPISASMQISARYSRTQEKAVRQVVEITSTLSGVDPRRRAQNPRPRSGRSVKREGAGDILIVCGGVISPKDPSSLQ